MKEERVKTGQDPGAQGKLPFFPLTTYLACGAAGRLLPLNHPYFVREWPFLFPPLPHGYTPPIIHMCTPQTHQHTFPQIHPRTYTGTQPKHMCADAPPPSPKPYTPPKHITFQQEVCIFLGVGDKGKCKKSK